MAQMKKKLLYTFSVLFLLSGYLNAQTRKEINDTIAKMPLFSIHKDNYFISGIPTNTEVSKKTADAKYQISFKQLLTRNTLPLDSYLYLTYTQKAFWNIYEFSSPFQEINFNPGIGLGKAIYKEDDQLAGLAAIELEHESNGRDSIYSRSWNRVTFSYHTSISPKTVLSVKAWVPFKYKDGNPELLEYVGPGEVNLSHEFKPDKLVFNLMIRKGLNWEWKGAIRSRLYYRPFEASSLYLMLEWYSGHAESLIDYSEFKSIVRFGFVIRSNELGILRAFD
ncbi:phospholipase A1 [Salegentibacter echinorum]|uniref:Phosphatidylcholine 1-acylhydrolase n=2 Tax=Salegentibacter echinorum TaxID=1073325 RepID=A0A1M5IIP4_SALEC|nr:phospholipase A1 [Salegentibacter echinorum]